HRQANGNRYEPELSIFTQCEYHPGHLRQRIGVAHLRGEHRVAPDVGTPTSTSYRIVFWGRAARRLHRYLRPRHPDESAWTGARAPVPRTHYSRAPEHEQHLYECPRRLPGSLLPLARNHASLPLRHFTHSDRLMNTPREKPFPTIRS